MNETARALLELFEQQSAKAERERKADPAAYEERRKKNRQEALDLAIERLNKISELLKALDDTPEEFTELSDLGSIEEIKARLIKEQDFYSNYYKAMDYETLPPIEDVIAATEEATRLSDPSDYLTGAEYNELISAALDGDESARIKLRGIGLSKAELDEELATAQATRDTNKELINTISDGNGAAAEALLLTATLADFEAAGADLTERQRNIILAGNDKLIRGIIYDMLFTSLLKLWRVISDRSESQTAGNLQLVPYNAAKPTKTAISVSKVAQKLIEIEEQGDKGAILSVGGKKDVIDISALMKYDDKNITVIGRPLTEFDKTVHDGAAAIYAAGNSAFTIQDLYRACNGIDIGTIKADTLAPYIESIEQSITRRLRIDATDQINAYYKGRVKKVVYENYFLPLKAVEIEMTNGEVVRGYSFLDAPPLYEYSSNISQVVGAPMKLLRAGKQIRNTPEVATMTNYLIKRIDGIKNAKNKLQPLIRYEAVFTAAGIDVSQLDRTQLKRKRDIVKAKLDYFKAQGFIIDYAEYKEGRAAAGVEIAY